MVKESIEEHVVLRVVSVLRYASFHHAPATPPGQPAPGGTQRGISCQGLVDGLLLRRSTHSLFEDWEGNDQG